MSKALEAAAREMWQCEKERAERADAMIGVTGEYIEPFEDTADAVWLPDTRRIVTAYLRAVGEVEGVIFKRAETAITGALNSHHPRTRTGGAATALCAALSALEPKDD